MLKKRIIPIFLSVCLLAGTCAIPASAEDLDDDLANEISTVNETENWGSNYDSETSFSIDSVDDLLAFAKMVNDTNSPKDFSGKTVTLMADLDLKNVDWVPIGSTNNNGVEGDVKFAGTFDGKDHNISNITLKYGIEESDPVYDAGGLFGIVSGTVKDVNVLDLSLTAAYNYLGGIAGILKEGGEVCGCTVSGAISGAEYGSEAYGSFVGGIVGESDGTIEDCESYCEIKDTLYSVGGIAGVVKKGSITSCINYGDVEGFGMVGGIVGDINDGSISDCSNSGDVSGIVNSSNTRENRSIGGIAGDAQTTSITNCENTGDINADELTAIGGVVGYLWFDATVEDCTNSGSVTGGDQTGGIVGFASAYSTGGYEVIECTNSGAVTGGNGVGGIVGVGTANNKESSTQIISGCTNSGRVSGESDIGGIVGENNSNKGITTTSTTTINNAAEVSGCINTGSVSEGGGAIVGKNSNASRQEDVVLPGIVESNFWPAELNLSAVGSGAGSSESETAETVKNNSSYKADGTLTETDIMDEKGNTLTSIADVVENLLSGTNSAPDVLKVTATFNNGGHGTKPESKSVVIGGKINLPTMSNSGYWTFLYWTVSGDSTQYAGGAEYTMTANTTFTANWRDDTPSSSGGGGSSTPTYTVTTPKVDNGSVTVSPKRAEKGDTVTITVKPDDGYELDELIVTDSKGNELKLTDKGNGKYTFTMPGSKVEIEASFVEIEKPVVVPKFTDVPADAYYADAVEWAVKNGITVGTGDGTTFSPDLGCTRAQVVTFLWRAAGCPAPKGAVNPFTDVESSAYYSEAVLWAVENGITVGTGDGTTFSPDEICSRAQIVTFLWRNENRPGAAAVNSFVDVDSNAYYAGAVEWAAENGITVGTNAEGTMFSPDDDCTRAQIVTFLYRCMA